MYFQVLGMVGPLCQQMQSTTRLMYTRERHAALTVQDTPRADADPATVMEHSEMMHNLNIRRQLKQQRKDEELKVQQCQRSVSAPPSSTWSQQPSPQPQMTSHVPQFTQQVPQLTQQVSQLTQQVPQLTQQVPQFTQLTQPVASYGMSQDTMMQ